MPTSKPPQACPCAPALPCCMRCPWARLVGWLVWLVKTPATFAGQPTKRRRVGVPIPDCTEGPGVPPPPLTPTSPGRRPPLSYSGGDAGFPRRCPAGGSGRIQTKPAQTKVPCAGPARAWLCPVSPLHNKSALRCRDANSCSTVPRPDEADGPCGLATNRTGAL